MLFYQILIIVLPKKGVKSLKNRKMPNVQLLSLCSILIVAYNFEDVNTFFGKSKKLRFSRLQPYGRCPHASYRQLRCSTHVILPTTLLYARHTDQAHVVGAWSVSLYCMHSEKNIHTTARLCRPQKLHYNTTIRESVSNSSCAVQRRGDPYKTNARQIPSPRSDFPHTSYRQRRCSTHVIPQTTLLHTRHTVNNVALHTSYRPSPRSGRVERISLMYE